MNSIPINELANQKKKEKNGLECSNHQENLLKKIIVKDIQITYGDFTSQSSELLLTTNLIKPTVELMFSLSGNYCLTHASGKIFYSEHQHNLMYFPENNSCVINTNMEHDSYRFFHVSFMDDYFKQLIDHDNELLSSFKTKMNDRQMMPLTFEMITIIDEVLHCKKKGILKYLFIKAKILKLLILQLEQYETLHSTNKPHRQLKDPDVHKVYLAKKLLDKSISKSITLIDLARQTGLNDFKLKKGFKEIYGTTVYGYLYELRMQEAKKMLLETTDSICDISLNCGYSSIQSFIKAFKRKFGLPPEKFRNTRL